MGLPALRSACARGKAIPDVVGVSPFMQAVGPFDITLAEHDEVWKRFADENSVIGEVPLPSGMLLKAVHNGKPYTNDPDGVHCMIAAHGQHNLPNPSEFASEDVARIVGIIRNFLHVPPHAQGYERTVGYQITDQRGRSQRTEKGLLSQTWANWHLHLLETSHSHIQEHLDSLPPSAQKESFEKLAKSKSSELFAVTSGLLLKPVVERSFINATGGSLPQFVQGGPNLAPGSVNVDVTNLSNDRLAHMMRSFQMEYTSHHREVAELFVANYDDFESPRILLPIAQREKNVQRYLQQLEECDGLMPSEMQMLMQQLMYLAHHAQPESVYLAEAKRRFAGIKDNKEREQREQIYVNSRVFWRVPAYTVGLQIREGKEIMTIHEITSTKGGCYEGYGVSPMSQINAPMSQEDYAHIHANAQKAFHEATHSPSYCGNIFEYA